MLINQADIDLSSGERVRARAFLDEAKAALEKTHPDVVGDAWRYAVWDSVNAELLAADGDTERALKTLAHAQPIIEQRFGSEGFYNLLLKRRTTLISDSLAHGKR